MKKREWKLGRRVQVVLNAVVESTPEGAPGVNLATAKVISVRPVAPKRPEVGATITGADVKATPWKRGTMLDEIWEGTSEGTHVLQGNGQWFYLDENGNLLVEVWESKPDYEMGFDGFPDAGTFKVKYLP